MTEPIARGVPEIILDNIYVALSDAYERLPSGTMNIKRCLNYLETEHRYEPPTGYEAGVKSNKGEMSREVCNHNVPTNRSCQECIEESQAKKFKPAGDFPLNKFEEYENRIHSLEAQVKELKEQLKNRLPMCPICGKEVALICPEKGRASGEVSLCTA